jgi:hypothetical protein
MKMHELLQKNEEIWDLFTRKEEYSSLLLDRYERFLYNGSSNRNILQPLVSEYLIENGYNVNYPEDKPFAVCLTHDIDVVYTSVSEKAVSAVRHLQKGSPSGFMRSLSQMRSRRSPRWNFKDIMALEEIYDAKSSFYFKAETEGERDYEYCIEDFSSVLGDIIDHECEVGLHGGHTTYTNPEEMKSKKTRLEKILNKKVTGYRNHFLRFKVPETWEYLHEAGFVYDTTLGYVDHIGFRSGMCHPFNPFNLKTGKPIGILEIPLIIMDSTLDKYMKIDARSAWEMLKKLIDTVSQNKGVLTLLWHNTYIIGDKRNFYEKILQYCAGKNAWMTSGEEIIAWWKKNNQFSA